jgi:hypothetical protein
MTIGNNNQQRPTALDTNSATISKLNYISFYGQNQLQSLKKKGKHLTTTTRTIEAAHLVR